MLAAAATMKWEARYKNGQLAVFKLSKKDGGGVAVPGYPHGYEVAGINNRYHPVMAAKLRGMVETGNLIGATLAANSYIAGYQDHANLWTKDQGLELFLRDCVFNRGPGGAAMILQIALNLRAGVGSVLPSLAVDGGVGPKTRAALAEAVQGPGGPGYLLKLLRLARERYERDYAHRDEDSEFWKGLVNRWNDIQDKASQYLGKED